MDEIKKISNDQINEIAASRGFSPQLVLKDYHITLILYLIRNVERIYFKGGTALQKIFLNYSRLSEDIDFTVGRDVKEVIKEIMEILEGSKFFDKITKDKDVEGFTRLVVHYKDFSNEDDNVFLDLNERANLLNNPEKCELKHFYKDIIPVFSFSTLAKEEMVAEKIASAIGRNQPRDHYDIYRIIKEKLPIDMEIIKKKCNQSNIKFDIIKMFNKANKLKNRWDEDLLPLLSEEVSFQEVMRTLANYFKLKYEKDKRKV